MVNAVPRLTPATQRGTRAAGGWLGFQISGLVGLELPQAIEEVARLIEGGDADPLVEAVDVAQVGLVEDARDAIGRNAARRQRLAVRGRGQHHRDRKSTRLNSSH